MKLIGFTLALKVSGCTREELESQAGQIMQELLYQEAMNKNVQDPAVSVEFGTMTMEIELEVTAMTLSEGEKIANRVVREAIQSVNGGTEDSDHLQDQFKNAELIPA